VERAAREIFERAIDLGGALSGEHGVGLLKRELLERNLGGAAVRTMRAIKDALDPQGILNPGKVFPGESEGDWGQLLLGASVVGDAVA
jgi:FAD/FMN-containing dehydrogenase